MSCSECGGPLVRHRWNTACDIMYCTDYRCRLFHTPAGTILTDHGEEETREREEKRRRILAKRREWRERRHRDLT